MPDFFKRNKKVPPQRFCSSNQVWCLKKMFNHQPSWKSTLFHRRIHIPTANRYCLFWTGADTLQASHRHTALCIYPSLVDKNSIHRTNGQTIPTPIALLFVKYRSNAKVVVQYRDYGMIFSKTAIEYVYKVKRLISWSMNLFRERIIPLAYNRDRITLPGMCGFSGRTGNINGIKR